MRSILLLACAVFLLPVAVAIPPDSGDRWTFGFSRDTGAWSAAGDHAALAWRSDASSFELTSLVVDGHEILDGLVVPQTLGLPEARGAILRFLPPGPVRGSDPAATELTLHDAPAGVLRLGCSIQPPDAELPPDPCRIAFPVGHSVDAVDSSASQLVLDVSMRSTEGDVEPCVRVVVNGVGELDGSTLAFAGDLHVNLVGVDNPDY